MMLFDRPLVEECRQPSCHHRVSMRPHASTHNKYQPTTGRTSTVHESRRRSGDQNLIPRPQNGQNPGQHANTCANTRACEGMRTLLARHVASSCWRAQRCHRTIKMAPRIQRSLLRPRKHSHRVSTDLFRVSGVGVGV